MRLRTLACNSSTLVTCIGYNFSAVWLKGSINDAPDALSRHSISEPASQDMLAETDIFNQLEPSISEIRATITNTLSSTHQETLHNAAKDDPECQQLRQFIIRDSHHTALNILTLVSDTGWYVHHNLTIDNNLIVNRCHLLIPPARPPLSAPSITSRFH